MKFVIEAAQTKRELPVPFAVAASPDDLEWLAEKLADAARTMRYHGAVYGWATITAEEVRGEPNTRPRPWDACGGPGYRDCVEDGR